MFGMEGHARSARCVTGGMLSAIILITFTACLMSGEVPAKQNKTVAALLCITAALEQYKEKFGEYPSPANVGIKLTIDGKEFDVGASLMLYQALTADGDDQIITQLKARTSSDGKVDDKELENTVVARRALPEVVFFKSTMGYLVLDGYGRPFQYSAGDVQSVNRNFDLWSYGDSAPPYRTDKTAKQDAAITAKWIKNW
jgi:hypothetical protein